MKHEIRRIDGALIAESDDGTFIELVEKNQHRLKYANLENANLKHANLEDANLKYANLRYADLEKADLRYASLWIGNREVVIK